MFRSFVVAMLGIATIGCGKKGPPLAPFVRIPAAVTQISASRLGRDVYVTLTIPAQNIDTSLPVSISRIDIYGYTGRIAPTIGRWPFLGNVVASVDVAPAPTPGEVPVAGERPLPGTAVTIRDTLEPEELVQGKVDTVPARRQQPDDLALPDPTVTLPLQRFYIAVPFSERGRPGPPGGQAALPLTPVPDAPTDVRVAYSTTLAIVAWEPPGGLFGFIVDDRLAMESPPFDLPTLPGIVGAAAPVQDNTLPPGPTRYNVYRELAPDPLAYPVIMPVGAAPPPMPVVATVPGATVATDEIEFGRTRCYTVRTVRGSAIGEPTPPVCFSPIDVFPPAPPAMPAAVAAEGAISLIWDPGSELDLGGYLVLRREVGSATLLQLTPEPITVARFRDSTVTSGTRYIYTVVAVDSQLPLPNMSAESLPVEETAR
jgi:hypothetical protein